MTTKTSASSATSVGISAADLREAMAKAHSETVAREHSTHIVELEGILLACARKGMTSVEIVVCPEGKQRARLMRPGRVVIPGLGRELYVGSEGRSYLSRHFGERGIRVQFFDFRSSCEGVICVYTALRCFWEAEEEGSVTDGACNACALF